MKTQILFISFLFLICQLPAISQTADFIGSQTSGCDTLTVKFTYSYTGTASSFLWTFGDGNTSTDSNPQYKYTKPGKYLVSLKVNGTDSVGKTDYITIGLTPNADFSYHDTLDFGSRTVVLVAASQSASAPYPYSYEWAISDGTSTNSYRFSHQFDSVGIYTAKLTIKDALGCTDSVTKAVEIRNKLNVPTVFTPNEDGVNDLLIVTGDNTTTYIFQVFSPSGMRVYESSSKVIVWDGRMFSGDKVRDGIYYYTISSKDTTPETKQSGFFYLYR